MKADHRQVPVRAFLVLAFTISWIAGIAANSLLGEWVATHPSVWRRYVPVALTTWSIGCTALWAWSRSTRRRAWRDLVGPVPTPATMLALLLVPVAITWLAYGVAGAEPNVSVGSLTSLAGHLLLQLVVIAIGEELGWRGFLLRCLASTRTLLAATFLTSVAWLLWHLPKLLSPVEVSVPLAVVILSSSVLVSLAWSKTGGSVLAAAALHAGINGPVYWLELSGAVSQDELLHGWKSLSLVYAALAVLALAWFRRTWLSPAAASAQ